MPLATFVFSSANRSLLSYLVALIGRYFRDGVILVRVITIQSTLHVLKSTMMMPYPADTNAARRVCSASSSVLAFNASAASFLHGYIRAGHGPSRLHAQATVYCTARGTHALYYTAFRESAPRGIY